MTDYKRHLGDRYDGRRIRSLDAFYKIIPFIMRSRVDSQNFFEDKIEISSTEAYLRRKRKSCEINIGLLHVLIAAMVRTISIKPAIISHLRSHLHKKCCIEVGDYLPYEFMKAKSL